MATVVPQFSFVEVGLPGQVLGRDIEFFQDGGYLLEPDVELRRFIRIEVDGFPAAFEPDRPDFDHVGPAWEAV